MKGFPFLLLAFTDEAVAEFKQKIKKHLYREIAINKEMSHRLKRKVYGIDSMHITTFPRLFASMLFM